MLKSAPIILVVFEAILSSSALPNVIDDAMIHLGSGDYALGQVKNSMFLTDQKPWAKWMRSLDKYRVAVGKSKAALMKFRVKAGTEENRLKNLLTAEMQILIEKMDGVLSRADEQREDEELSHLILN